MNVERTTNCDLHELRLPNWHMIDQAIEEAMGVKQGQEVILGYYNGNPLVAGGEKNYIENVFEIGDGKFDIEVHEIVGFGTGSESVLTIWRLTLALASGILREANSGRFSFTLESSHRTRGAQLLSISEPYAIRFYEVGLFQGFSRSTSTHEAGRAIVPSGLGHIWP